MKKALIYAILISFSAITYSQDKNNDKYYDIFQSLDIYNAILRELDINYVDTLNYKYLNEVAIQSILGELDPYTVYIPAQQEEDLKTMTTGVYGGIGAIIQKHGEYVVISEPKFGLPAHKNGLLAGDEIIFIDGENMKNKDNSYVSEKLRGIPGTKINIKVRRNGDKKLIKKSFLREAIQINSVTYYGVIEDNTGYILLSDFTNQSYLECKNALMDLKRQGIKNLIIDLRNNGGGLMQEAVNIASMFLPIGTNVVSMKGRNGKGEKKYRTAFNPIMPDIPIVVLINENSASASEILAGAFQDLDRAIIVGDRSFGKGVVQSIKPIPHNAYLKITTAKYFLPSGRCVQSVDDKPINHVDYNRNIPDSLTNEFKTSTGRIVRDNSGIKPDITFEKRRGNYISYHLFANNIVFDFATQYYYSHPQIDTPNKFNITDEEYAQFINFVESKNFTYQLESEKILQQLKNMTELEGIDKNENMKEIIEQLTPLLKPDIKRDLNTFRKDIQEMLEAEIVKRYYYQKGYTEYSLRYDEWLKNSIDAFKK